MGPAHGESCNHQHTRLVIGQCVSPGFDAATLRKFTVFYSWGSIGFALIGVSLLETRAA